MRGARGPRLRWLIVLGALLSLWATPGRAWAQSKPKPRPAVFYWGTGANQLYVDVTFADIVDARTRRKLARGLPTTIVFTGLLHAPGVLTPVATTVQSCKITWHVWEELYRVEVSRPGSSKPSRHWTPTVRGVLRRCAQAQMLMVAEAYEVPRGSPVYLQATVRINPISKALLSKIKRWVSRPTGTAPAAPGSALFSTFTGLFMTRVGDAEKTVIFVTELKFPLAAAPKKDK